MNDIKNVICTHGIYSHSIGMMLIKRRLDVCGEEPAEHRAQRPGAGAKPAHKAQQRSRETRLSRLPCCRHSSH